MNLEEALAFTEEKKKEELSGKRRVSDGCSFAPDLGIFKWCEMHDFLRYFSPITSWEADKLFFEGISSEGFKYFPIAAIYWTAVRIEAIITGKK